VSVPDGSNTDVTTSDRHAADLAAPFSEDAVSWSVVEPSDAGDEVRVEPRLPLEAICERFDAVLGVWGWSVHYGTMPGDAVACHLTIDGLTKGAVAGPALTGGGAETAAVAFALAAARFGVRGRWPTGVSAWVACDPGTLEPLHAPDPAQLQALARRAPADGPLGEGPPAGGPPADEVPAYRLPGDDPPPDHPHADEPPTVEGGFAAAIASPKPEGQQMIDRLIDRLKDRGLGLQAARILVRHGGYGKDPQAARELYGELRQLLLDALPPDEAAVGAPAATAGGRPEVAAGTPERAEDTS